MRPSSRLAWIAALLTLLLATAIRVRLLSIPLERDEGEYAYAGQVILQGGVPYVHVYNMKMPGIYACYAGILALFGETTEGIRLGLLLANLAAAGLTAALVRRRFGSVAGAGAAAAYGILSLGPAVQGTFANAEAFVLVPALAGLLCLDRARTAARRGWVLGGAFLLGLAFLVKQHGAAFAAFGAVVWLADELARRPRSPGRLALRAVGFAAVAAAPLALACLLLWRAGALDRFRFWVLDYAATYVASMPLDRGLATLLARSVPLLLATPGIWILTAAGLVAAARGIRAGPREARSDSWLILGFFLTSFLAVCPGLYFRPHYFVLLLPAAAAAAGIALGRLAQASPPDASGWRRFRGGRLALGVLILAVAQGVFAQRAFFFQADPIQASRAVYGLNPFPESLEVARYLREHTSPTERIAVVGSEPQIYFYAQRRGATGYIYTYALMEVHPFAARMQQEMREEIEAAHPRYLVFVNAPSSWILRRRSRRGFLDWFRGYLAASYRPCGYADLSPVGRTTYVWDDAARDYRPRGAVWLGVYERKTP